MIHMDGFTAVICCDSCLKELSRGPYPADAADNLPPENWVICGDGERSDEHYCAQCHADMEKQELREQLDMARESGMSQSDWDKQQRGFYCHDKDHGVSDEYDRLLGEDDGLGALDWPGWTKGNIAMYHKIWGQVEKQNLAIMGHIRNRQDLEAQLSSANARIKELEQQVKDLQDWHDSHM